MKLEMTSAREYAKYGINLNELIEMLEASLSTIHETAFAAVVYVGIPNKSSYSYEDPKEPFGKIIKAAGKPVYVHRYTQGGATYFCEVETGAPWNTGNGNATLSPWDARELLKALK